MAFVPGFEHDIFISYAHVDDKPRYADPKGWVTHLYEALPAWLHPHIGRASNLSIFMDPKVDGTDKLSDTIVGKVRSSAILVSVLTEGYLESEWCLTELRTFCNQRHPTFALSVCNQIRAVKVLLTDLPLDRHPEPFRQVTGYNFFSVDASGNAYRFRRTEERDPDTRHWDRLEDLARSLGGLLKAMKGVADSPGVSTRIAPSGSWPTTGDETDVQTLRVATQTLAAGNGPTVFVAEVSGEEDLQEQRDQLSRALTQRGIQVLPQPSLPRTRADLEAAVLEGLERSVLSVHMLGQSYGRRPEGDPRSVVHIQTDLAAEVGRRRRLARIVWLPATLDVEQSADEEQRQLVRSLENEVDPSRRAEVLRTGLEELKQLIFRRLLPPRAQRDVQPLVYLVCAAEDKPEALAVKAALRRAGNGTLLPPEGTDPPAWEETHQRYLRLCDALLIVYGQVDAAWVQQRAAEALELVRLGSRRPRPLLAAGIYEGPPSDKADIGVDTEDLVVVNCRNGFVEASLVPWLAAITARRPGSPP